ncbi:hypothetical protein PMIT1313_00658 [Prochlorococcus marinus str. MIT 1313]|nr:hypothetical protein PMIT1313_00658 [Prochlorococcus marinus str. MIT 1313]KZR72736.1 hypothetical protein PMIT1318_00698 [Prochlorococcus marinus str. MIT 1318]
MSKRYSRALQGGYGDNEGRLHTLYRFRHLRSKTSLQQELYLLQAISSKGGYAN